ncbi:putative nuclease HARBI1 isoform X2 [Diabrotica virgifera virgifera]|uniref:DDE Tnp4 domain-containing protein n=1 Tax=Diabrotica virgifera virgifera TaxID=50390 RepID=A0ABM5JTW0_DIAVI|nr:putative nuclease HARBI1 isoform X2 [Diabrotica virgifera virgifera]XP_050512730.1 putative nuclease HARBI1 isoform X2 [Diabrotica virgifera virgifera]
MRKSEIPGLLIGNSRYACKYYLFTSVLQPGNDQENRYNSAHVRTRNVAEKLFGTWKKQFPCLQKFYKPN